MKQCPRCGSNKPFDEYYKHPDTADGRMGVCKECHKSHMKALRRDNPSVQERDRKRGKRPDRIAKNIERTKKHRAKNPDAYRAQTAVGNAIRDKRLFREPCAICAATENIHAHHKDYSKPLDVVWLCARCHHRLHAIFPELEGANKRSAI
jgi:superfamily II helicase